MQIARYSLGGQVGFGIVEALGDDGAPTADTYLAAIDGHPFGALTPTGIRHPYADVRLLAPVLPSKVVAIGRNYADHAARDGRGGADGADALPEAVDLGRRAGRPRSRCRDRAARSTTRPSSRS